MLFHIYNQLLIMSVIAGGLYLILKLLSALTLKYFTAAWHYCSYLLLYTFFLIPYHKWLSWLDLSFLRTVDNELGFPSVVGLNPSGAISPTANKIAILPEDIYTAPWRYLDFMPSLLMAGTLIFIAVILIQNFNLNRRIFRMCRLADKMQALEVLSKCKQEMGISKEVPIYFSSHITTPFLYGIFKPRIVLPDIEFTTEELQHVYLHELTHWKRHDAWLKCLLLIINAIHWFNPLAYMARRDLDHFCELSCDESVVKSMNSQERRRYCELMLNVLWNVADQNVKLFTAFSDKRKQLERRVDMLLKNEGLPSKKWVGLLAVVMTLAIALLGTVVAAYAASGGEVFTEKKDASSINKLPNTSAFDAEKLLNITFDKLDGSVKISDSKEVFLEAVPTTESKTEGQVGIMAVYNIDWDVYAGESAYGVSQLSMSKGNRVLYDISWSPQPGVIRVGLYNRNTGTFYWAASSTTPPLNGTITVPATGLYSFAVGNTTDTDVHVTGSFTY